MQSTTDSLAARALRWLSNAVYRYPRLFFYPQLLLFIASIVIAAVKPQIQFDTSRDDLVGAEKQYHKNFLRYKKEFLAQDELVAVVESEDMEKNSQFVERLGDRLVQETNLFTDVLYNNDVTMLGKKALLFFPESDLKELLLTLRDYRDRKSTRLNSSHRTISYAVFCLKKKKKKKNKQLKIKKKINKKKQKRNTSHNHTSKKKTQTPRPSSAQHTSIKTPYITHNRHMYT